MSKEATLVRHAPCAVSGEVCVVCGGRLYADDADTQGAAVGLYVWADNEDDDVRGHMHEDCVGMFFDRLVPGRARAAPS